MVRTGAWTVTTCAVRTCSGTAATSPAPGTLSVVGTHYTLHIREMEEFIISTISGKPHANFELFASVLFGLGAIGSLTFSYALRDRESRPKEKIQ